MGGVRTDLDGRTSLRRLHAAGEVAAAGVHGANRLASNSLLEGLVFGGRAGRSLREWAGKPMLRSTHVPAPDFPQIEEEELRGLAWDHCGIVRSGDSLAAFLDRLDSTRHASCLEPHRFMFEVRSMFEVARLIGRCALARRESRGGHYRIDYPEKSLQYQKHSLITNSRNEVLFI
jgi:L-aspartate oxidase